MKRVLVYGIGGVGGYIGALLDTAVKKSEIELSFIARGPHLAAMKANGLRYRSPDGGETTVRPSLITEEPAEVGVVDFVFLCVKGYDLDSVCRALAPVIDSQTVIVPLLNGADIYERVRGALKKGIVIPACIYIISSIAEPGLVVHSSGKGNIVVGIPPDNPRFDPAPLRALLDDAAVPYEWFDDPFPAIWTKYLFIASFALVTGMSGATIGGVANDPELAKLIRGIQEEIVAIATAKGISLAPDVVDVAMARGTTFSMSATTSFQRDLQAAGKPNEGESFGGTILTLGKALGVPTPTTEKVYRAILAKH